MRPAPSAVGLQRINLSAERSGLLARRSSEEFARGGRMAVDRRRPDIKQNFLLARHMKGYILVSLVLDH
jgi:hypothetical protein